MKKENKILVLLSLFLFVISFSVISIFGNTYTLAFDLNNSSRYELSVEEEKGKIEILSKKEWKDKLYIKIKAIKTGKVYIFFDNGSFQTGKGFYIHKGLIITEDRFLGKSTGSEVIPISIFIILSYILFLLIKKYRLSVKENIYQYKNIAYLGIIIFISFFIIQSA